MGSNTRDLIALTNEVRSSWGFFVQNVLLSNCSMDPTSTYMTNKSNQII
ncbi:hypothetical protein AMTRI_Chr09g36070 [Amborella trichopoda]